MGRLVEHFKKELKIAGYIPLDQKQESGPNKGIQENLLELAKTFEKQDHSGFSANYCIEAFKTLASFNPLRPLTGEDWEWSEVSEGVFQNNRCSHVFKDHNGAYDIRGKVFKEPDGWCYTCEKSHTPINFPYVPKTEYIDVQKLEE